MLETNLFFSITPGVEEHPHVGLEVVVVKDDRVVALAAANVRLEVVDEQHILWARQVVLVNHLLVCLAEPLHLGRDLVGEPFVALRAVDPDGSAIQLLDESFHSNAVLAHALGQDRTHCFGADYDGIIGQAVHHFRDRHCNGGANAGTRVLGVEAAPLVNTFANRVLRVVLTVNEDKAVLVKSVILNRSLFDPCWRQADIGV